jgi:hypothetical protein
MKAQYAIILVIFKTTIVIIAVRCDVSNDISLTKCLTKQKRGMGWGILRGQQTLMQ